MIAGIARRARAYWEARPWLADAALLALVTACAAALRLSLLGDIPYGVHADEAQVGTDAHRILRDGWIGVYTHAALGQPAGHAYLTTPSIWLLGDTAFALRLPLALVGVAAVPLLYLLVRVSAGRLEAFFASALLAVSYWHLFYSRVAHWSISYGTVLLAVLLCLMLGMRTRKWPWFVASGALLGLGIYTYNIYPIAIAAVMAFVALMTLRYRDALRWWLRSVALMFAAAFVVALPMIVYVADPDAYYWDHIRNYSEVDVTKSPEFKQAGTLGKIRIVAGQARTFGEAYTVEGKLDAVDGNGLRPVFDVPTLVLLAIGLVIAARRWREPLVVAALCCFFIIPLPALPQRGSIMRQPVAAAPFAMFIAALPLAAMARHARRAGPAFGALSVAAVTGALVLIAALTVHDYFWTWRKDPWPRLIYFSQMTSASEYMRELPPDTRVLFYSDRASINLETRQFLAPDVRGQDRSTEFGSNLSTDAGDRSRTAVFVLLGEYLPLLPEIEQRYPGGRERIVVRDGKIEFYAYELPAE